MGPKAASQIFPSNHMVSSLSGTLTQRFVSILLHFYSYTYCPMIFYPLYRAERQKLPSWPPVLSLVGDA